MARVVVGRRIVRVAKRRVWKGGCMVVVVEARRGGGGLGRKVGIGIWGGCDGSEVCGGFLVLLEGWSEGERGGWCVFCFVVCG